MFNANFLKVSIFLIFSAHLGMNVDNMAFELPEEYASDYYIDDPRVLSGLELAKYVLLILTNNRDTIKKIAEDLDDDEYFISGVVTFSLKRGGLKKTIMAITK